MTSPATPFDRSGGSGFPVPFAHASHSDTGAGERGPMLIWQFAEPVRSISSGMLGGGLHESSWIVNAHVRADYGRMDPAQHLQQIAAEQGLDPDTGAGLMTAARVEYVATGSDGPVGENVRCDATVGVSHPTWAAAAEDRSNPLEVWQPGTINLVCQIPAPLTDAALVGAVITATEAKTQALLEAGVPGTGTASDAIVVCCPRLPAGSAAVPFAGPRSDWGARLARAVHGAVRQGLSRWPGAE